MRWEWDSDGDNRVAQLWHLRTELSLCKDVVYSKWFRGRATLFSREVFRALLSVYGTASAPRGQYLNRQALEILENLEMESPLSTKQIKLATDLRGKIFEREYERAMKQLWHPGYTVAFGEVDDGAFPSLAVGASQVIFEELWEESKETNRDDAYQFLSKKLGEESLFLKFLVKGIR